VQSVEAKVDASLIEQLRTGNAEMSAIRVGERRQFAAGVAAKQRGEWDPLNGPGADTPAGVAPRVPPVGFISGYRWQRCEK